ncbi:hypothetical protein MBLNU459_g2321t1 [Dothideomycetes sp. NU459]
MSDRQLNLLSIDGGGVRGLSALCVLQKLMEQIDPDDPPRPCDYFDMIGGTSTGGLIAIMLGRLRMTVQQCIDEYTALSRQVFVRKTKWPVNLKLNIQERFDSETLAAKIREVSARHTGESESLLRNDDPYACKVFVCATNGNTSDTVLLTTYRREQGNTNLFNNTRIWEAGRATSAASSYFDPITIGPLKQRFHDGGTGANNPIRQLWTEAKQILAPHGPLEDRLNCIVSIGTGIPTLHDFGTGVVSAPQSILRIATETEHTARHFLQEHQDLSRDGRYCRFNAPSIRDISLDKAEDLPAISAKTDHYLEGAETWDKVKACAALLRQRESTLPLLNMHS